jgi:hypothetical protein
MDQIKNIRFTYQWWGPIFRSAHESLRVISAAHGHPARERCRLCPIDLQEFAMNTYSDCREAERQSFSLPFGGVFQWITRGVDGIVRAYEGRRILRQLARSDDRMLRDIGLDRSDLRNAASEPIYRDPTALLAGHVDEVRPRRRVHGRTPSAPASRPEIRLVS